MRRDTGTWAAQLLPPVKLYLGNPVHLAAGGGKEGANSGAKSNDPEAMPSLSLTQCIAHEHRVMGYAVASAGAGEASSSFIAASFGMISPVNSSSERISCACVSGPKASISTR